MMVILFMSRGAPMRRSMMPPMSSMLLRRHWARRRGQVTDRFANWEFGLSHDAARDQSGEQQRCSNFLHVFSFQVYGRESPGDSQTTKTTRRCAALAAPRCRTEFESAEVTARSQDRNTRI